MSTTPPLPNRKPAGMSWESFAERRIRDAIASPHPGPAIVVLPVEVERVVAEWRAARSAGRKQSG